MRREIDHKTTVPQIHKGRKTQKNHQILANVEEKEKPTVDTTT